MPRHFGNVDRVVGNIPEKEKEEILNDRAEMFTNQEFEELRGKEREKTPTELKLINLANEVTSLLRRVNGLGDFDVPPQNIHVIPERDWPRGQRRDAFYNSQLQAVVLCEAEANTVFFKKAVHELIHFKSYNAVQVTDSEDPDITEYRMGLVVDTRDGERKYFRNLNEAVTEDITKEIVQHMRHPLLEEDMRETERIRTEYPKATNDSGQPFFNDDTYYARFADGATKIEDGRSRPLIGENFGYPKERIILHELVQKLFERNHGQFKSVNEVHELFRNAMITGNILPLGKLVDHTFGRGTLRRIGELDENVDAQGRFVKSL